MSDGSWNILGRKVTALHRMVLLTFIDMIGVGLVIPSLPSLSREIGLDATQYGLMGTFYGIGQLVGSPMCGTMSDTLGRKRVLLMSFAGSSLFYGLLGMAWSLPILLFCRLGVGLVKQTMTMSASYISDITNEQQRTKALSLNAVSTGMGFIVGPVCGSLLARINVRYPFYLSSAIFAFNFILGSCILPEVNNVVVDKIDSNAPHPILAGQTLDDCPAMRTTVINGGIFSHLSNTVTNIRAIANESPLLLKLVIMRLIANGTLIMLESTMLMFLQIYFKIDARSNGFFLGFVGIVGVLTNLFFIAPITRVFGEGQALVGAFVIGGFATLGAGFSPSFFTFMGFMAGLALGQNLNRTCLLSLFSQMVPAAKRGTYMGMADSLDSFNRVLLPLFGGILLDIYAPLPFIFSSVVQLLLAYLWYVWKSDLKYIAKEEAVIHASELTTLTGNKEEKNGRKSHETKKNM